MYKIPNNQFRLLILSVFVCVGLIANAQTSTDNSVMSWTDQSGWTTAVPDLTASSLNIKVYGEVTASDLTFTGDNINLEIYDTLIVNGNFFANGAGMNLHIFGILIVRGNFNIGLSGGVIFDNASFFAVTGNYEEDGSVGGAVNSSEYVLGATEGILVDAGNRDDLISEQSSELVDLVLGATALNFNVLTQSATSLCSGDNTNEITAIADGGSWGGYEYSLDNTSWQNSGVFSGKAAGTYTVYVKDDGANTFEDDITLYEPDPFDVTVLTPNLFTCPSPEASGEIGFQFNGGTLPATDTVIWKSAVRANGYVVYGGDLVTLGGGFYYAVLKDQNDCPFVTDTVEVVEDVHNPTLEAMPFDYFESFSSTFSTRSSVYDTLDVGFIPYTYNNGESATDTMLYNYNATNLNNLQLKLFARQSTTTWDNSDSLEIRIDYGLGTYQRLLIDACEWVGSGDDVGEGDGTSVNELVRNTGWLDISAADGEVSFNVKIICHSSDGSKIYYIDDLLVRGSRLSKVIPTYVSGSPTCADEDGNCGGVDYTDSGINWNCTDPGNQEFYFTRTWKSVDLCGKESATQQQLIRVGEEPFFATLPKDTILDFCNNEPTINSPLASDLPCDGAVSVEWIVTREIPLNDGNDTIPGVGSGNVSGFEFPMPTVDEDSTYIIIWTLTDDAQITNTYTQQVKILKPIDVTISPSPYDFCSKETATFTLSITGGTGSYLSLEPGAAIGGAVTITPDGSWDNGAKQYTTNLLDLSGVVDISVHVEDVNALIEGVNVVGGCTSTDFPLSDFVFSHGTDFTIRTLISTGAISREP